MTLADTNVLLDLVTDDPDWAEWSIAKLADAALTGQGPIRGNGVVYAELPPGIQYLRTRLTSFP